MALGIKGTNDDTWIASMIPQAQALIDNELGYSFQSDGTADNPATRIFSGKGTPDLFVGWISQLVQVQQKSYTLTVDYSGYWNVGATAMEDITQDCYIGPDNRNPGFVVSRLSGMYFHNDRQNYIVRGVFGYSAVPFDITRACTRLVVHWYKMRDTNYADTVAEQGSVRQKYTKQMPVDVVEILDNYRLTVFYST